MLTTSNQTDIHEDLNKYINKHLTHTYQRPIAEHSLRSFDQLFNKLKDIKNDIILDSGCGTGLSCIWLSHKFPNHHIIGIDKSEHRLQKIQANNKNISFCRAELVDFWRLINKTNWEIDHHFLLYPNPWPKKKHLLRRWHAHPVFPEILKIGKSLTLRSDWFIYIKEFELALKIAGINNIQLNTNFTDNAISAFEQKYIKQGRELFELKADII